MCERTFVSKSNGFRYLCFRRFMYICFKCCVFTQSKQGLSHTVTHSELSCWQGRARMRGDSCERQMITFCTHNSTVKAWCRWPGLSLTAMRVVMYTDRLDLSHYRICCLLLSGSWLVSVLFVRAPRAQGFRIHDQSNLFSLCCTNTL